MDLSEADWAWIAGLFEGEGNIDFVDRAGVKLTIRMTDRDVLQQLDRLCPSPDGLRVYPQEHPSHSTIYQWYVCRREVVQEFLAGLLATGRLGERRAARARQAIDRLGRNGGLNGEKTHCPQGHRYRGANLLTEGNGTRRCKRCRTDQERSRRLARAAA